MERKWVGVKYVSDGEKQALRESAPILNFGTLTETPLCRRPRARAPLRLPRLVVSLSSGFVAPYQNVSRAIRVPVRPVR
jgi:hypothetical protein